MTKKLKTTIKSKQPPGKPGNSQRPMLVLFFTLLILGTSLFLLPSLLERYVSSRFTLASGILLWGGIVFYLRSRISPKVAFHVFDILYLVFYLVNVIGISQAHNFGEAVFTAQKIGLSFWAYFLIRHMLSQSPDIRPAILNITAVLTGILQIFLVGQILYYLGARGLNNDALYAVSGLMGNKSLASEFLFMLLPFNVMSIYENKGKGFAKLPLALVIISIALMAILQVRTVYIALFVFLSVFTASQLPALINYSFRQWLKLAASVIAGIATIGLILQMTGSLKAFTDRVNPLNYLESTSASERRFVWYKTRELINDHWWTGVGTGNWKVMFPSKGLSGAYRMQEQNIVFTRTHNDYLEIWAETGFIGLLSYLSIFIIAIVTCVYLLFNEEVARRREALLLLLSIIGYCIICFFDFPKERIEHQLLLSLTLAWVAWRGQDFLSKWGISFNTGIQSATGYLFSGIMLFNLLVGYYRINGDYCAYKVAYYKNVYPKMIEYSRAGQSIFYTLDPSAVPMSWFEGLGYSQTQQMEKARAAFKNAYDLSPYSFQVISNYATTLAALQEFEAAIPLYLKCMEINPKFEDGFFNLSFCYFSLKKYDTAIEWVSKARRDTARQEAFIQQINQQKSLEIKK